LEKVSIEIPKRIYEEIESRVDGEEFKTVEDYIIFVLEELLREEPDEDEFSEEFTVEDEEKVKERLRNLGYL
jgi:Arc/MetJ-type ribon-helix-helix transcriptional regulator